MRRALRSRESTIPPLWASGLVISDLETFLPTAIADYGHVARQPPQNASQDSQVPSTAAKSGHKSNYAALGRAPLPHQCRQGQGQGNPRLYSTTTASFNNHNNLALEKGATAENSFLPDTGFSDRSHRLQHLQRDGVDTSKNLNQSTENHASFSCDSSDEPRGCHAVLQPILKQFHSSGPGSASVADRIDADSSLRLPLSPPWDLETKDVPARLDFTIDKHTDLARPIRPSPRIGFVESQCCTKCFCSREVHEVSYSEASVAKARRFRSASLNSGPPVTNDEINFSGGQLKAGVRSKSFNDNVESQNHVTPLEGHCVTPVVGADITKATALSAVPGFAETIRAMRYRAFLRWYTGAHEQTWSKPATAVMCILAGALTLFAHYSLCSYYALRSEIFLAQVAAILALGLLLIVSGTLFLPRWSVRIALLYTVASLATVLTVNIASGVDWTVPERVARGYMSPVTPIFTRSDFLQEIQSYLQSCRDPELHPGFDETVNTKANNLEFLLSQLQATRSLEGLESTTLLPPEKDMLSDLSSRPHHRIKRLQFGMQKFQETDETVVSDGPKRSIRAAQAPSFSEAKCRSLLAFPISYLVVEALLVIVAFLYTGVLGRCARFYFLKSKLFERNWKVLLCQRISLFVPAHSEGRRRRARRPSKEPFTSGAWQLRQVAVGRPRLLSAEAKPWSHARRLTDDDAGASTRRLKIADGYRIECICAPAWHLKNFRYLIRFFLCLNLWNRTSGGGPTPVDVQEEARFCCQKLGCCKRRRKAGAKKIDVHVQSQTKPEDSLAAKKVKRVSPTGFDRSGFMRVTFVGETDSDLRPDGFGFWREVNHFYGERLVGYWDEGVPNGPHKSRECGTGSGFMCIRIGWARFTLNDELLKYGVANIECSVSGMFYRGYPSVKLLWPDGQDPFSTPVPSDGRKSQETTSPLPNTAAAENMQGIERKIESSNGFPDPSYSPDGAVTLRFPDSNLKTGNNPGLQAAAQYLQRFPRFAPNVFPPGRFDTLDSAHLGGQAVSTSRSAGEPFYNSCASEGCLSDQRQNRLKKFGRTVNIGVAGVTSVFKLLRRRESEEDPAYKRLMLGRRNVAWCLAELTPHTPNFGIQPRSEMVITVDQERGLYISGYIPRERVVPLSDDDSCPFVPKQQVEAAVSRHQLTTTTSLPSHMENRAIELSAVKNRGIPRLELARQQIYENDSHTLRKVTSFKSLLLSPKQTTSRDGENHPSTLMRASENLVKRPSLTFSRDPQHARTLPEDVTNQDITATPPARSTAVAAISIPIAEAAPATAKFSRSTPKFFFGSKGPAGPTSNQTGRRYVPRALLELRSKSKETSTAEGVANQKKRKSVPKDRRKKSILKEQLQHTPYYRRPTLEKDVNKINTSELRIRVILRRLVSPMPLNRGLPSKVDDDNGALRLIDDFSARRGRRGRAYSTIEEHPDEEHSTNTIDHVLREPDVCTCDCHRQTHESISESPLESLSPRSFLQSHVGNTTDNAGSPLSGSSTPSTVRSHDFAEETLLPPLGIPPDRVKQRQIIYGSLDTGELKQEILPEIQDPLQGFEAAELEADGWLCMDAAGSPEVLLYVHGYNNSHIESLQMLGQMAAFGNYPNHIRVFLFSWPAGAGFWEFFKARKAAEDCRTHQALANVLIALRDNGIRQVHIMCHSMGSRLFLKSFRSMRTRIFQEVDGKESRAIGNSNKQKLLQLVSVTFLNPEYYLDEFVSTETKVSFQDYPILRNYCNQISIFADAKDQALWWSETISGKRALGKSVFGLCRSAKKLPLGELDDDTVKNTKQPPRFLNTVSFFHLSTNAQVLADGPDTVPLSSQRRFIRGSNRATAKFGIEEDDEDEEIDWLDLDVIDTTFMDQNVHSMRHSFWNLNREIIEDIRELMVTRKRARQRIGRLDR